MRIINKSTEITRLEVTTYCNSNNIAIQLYSKGKDSEFETWEEPYAMITKNLGIELEKKNQAYVDINNCPWAKDFIEEYKLGKDTGIRKQCGYCTYPLYEFDMEELRKYEVEKL